MYVEREVCLDHDLLLALVAFGHRPLLRRAGVQRLCGQVHFHVREVLQQADEEERHLVVRELSNPCFNPCPYAIENCIITYLLAKTDARPSIKRKEDEGVRSEVFVQALIQEPIRVKFQS